MKEKAAKKYEWVSIDVTTDSEERYVVNLIFGVLAIERERDRSYLFASKVLEKVNHTTIAMFFDECVDELSELQKKIISIDSIPTIFSFHFQTWLKTKFCCV